MTNDENFSRIEATLVNAYCTTLRTVQIVHATMNPSSSLSATMPHSTNVLTEQQHQDVGEGDGDENEPRSCPNESPRRAQDDDADADLQRAIAMSIHATSPFDFSAPAASPTPSSTPVSDDPPSEQSLGLDKPEIIELLRKHDVDPDKLLTFINDLSRIVPFYAGALELNQRLTDQKRQYEQAMESAAAFRERLDNLLATLPRDIPGGRVNGGGDGGGTSTSVSAGAAETAGEKGDDREALTRIKMIEHMLACYDNDVSARFDQAQPPPSNELIQCCTRLCHSIGTPFLVMQCMTSPEQQREGRRKQQQRQEQNIPNCPVCLSAPITRVIDPCGHFVCDECRGDVRHRCPVCRNHCRTIRTFRVYFT